MLFTLAQTPQWALKHFSASGFPQQWLTVSGDKYGHAQTTLGNYFLKGVWGALSPALSTSSLLFFHIAVTLTQGHPDWCVWLCNLAVEGILFIVCHHFKAFTFITFQTAVWNHSVKHERVSVCWLSANPKDTFSLFTTNDRQYWFPLESLTVTL